MGKVVDLSGKKFGRLKVLEYEGLDDKYHRYAQWKCRCECGNNVSVIGYMLNRGYVKSCGCMQDEARRKTGRANYTEHKLILNDKLNKNNTSGYKGVVWHAQRQKWAARIKVNYKMYHLLLSENINDCIKVRQMAEDAIREGTFETFIERLKK